MNKTKLLYSAGIVSTAVLTLVACGKGNSTAKNENAKTASKFPQSVPVKKTKKGGTLKYAIMTDTPFTGIFSDELSTTAIDSSVAEPGEEELFDTDDNFKITNKGPATMKLDRKAKTITIKIKKGVKWSDGKQVNAKDVEYPYEILANKATKAQRYSNQFEEIVGMKEYHNGKSKTISGIEMPEGPDGLTVILHFKEMKPGMVYSGNGYYWEYAAPYHYLKDIPFEKLQSSDQIRKKPLYFGPYKVQKLVRGQSVTWVPNKYYWRGQPKLDKVVSQVISQNSISQAIKSHKFDIAQVVNSQWNEVKDTKGVNFVAQIPLGYHYIGFRVGKWNAKAGKNVMNSKAKMNNQALRQAMTYAINIDEVDQHYTSGLSFRVPTLIPAQFGDYFDKKAKGYTYNLKKANQILDKAGYKKKGQWRVQPNGKPLTIKFLAMTGSSIQSPTVQNYIQQWKKIGIKVKLVGGRLTEFNSFYDKLGHDDPQVDMFLAAWSLASEPSPASLYGETSQMNYSRFATPENNKLLQEIDSQKSFDHTYRVKKFHEWQKYMNKKAYVVPVDNSYKVIAVNNKVTGYSTKPSDNSNGHQLWYKIGFIK